MTFQTVLRKIFTPRNITVTVLGTAWVSLAWFAADKTVKVNAELRKHKEAEIRASIKVRHDTIRITDTVRCTVYVTPKRPKPITRGEIERWD